MKFNWGTGIALVYTTFAVAMLFAVYRSTLRDNSLVSEQYYADDLAYQQQYDKIANAQQLNEPVRIEKRAAEGQVALQFPTNMGKIEGTIQFFCPADSKSDLKVPIQLNADHQQAIPLQLLRRKGLWEVKIDWQANQLGYFSQERLIL